MIQNNLSKILGKRQLEITKVNQDTGISRTTITSLYYNRAKGINFDTLSTLCEYLDITPNELLNYTEERENKAIGKRIKAIRLSLGLTGKEFGHLIDNASSGVVANWENGVNKPNVERLRRIAEIGLMTVDELISEGKREMDNITFRGYLLEHLHDKGYRYIIKDEFEEIYAIENLQNGAVGKFVKWLTSFSYLFKDIEPEGHLNIAVELGLFDWSTVPDNTPVLVRNNVTEPWEYRHFYKYSAESDYPFICYIDGKTSYTVKSIQSIVKYDNWKFCKLAEVDDENKL